MKRLLFTIALSLFVVMGAYAQKKVLRDATKALKKGELQDAITLGQQAAENEETTKNPDVYITVGKAYLQTFVESGFENIDAARESLDWYEKALKFGDQKLAQTLSEPPVFNPKDPTEYIGGGEDLGLLEYYVVTEFNNSLQNEEYENAYAFGKLSLKIDPTFEKYFFAGYAADMAGNKKDAYDAFKEVLTYEEELEEFENLEYIYGYLMEYERNQENNDEVLRYARLGQEKFPDNRMFKTWEVDILIQTDRMDEAISGLQKIIDAGDADKATYYTMGYLQWNNGQLDAAEENAKKALELDSEYADAIYLAGSVIFNKGVDVMKEANAEIEDNARYERLREQALSKFREAMPIFEKGLKMDPKDLYTLRPLSTIYDQLAMPEKRDEILDRIDEIEAGGGE